jgi:predicted glycoside hydrolase/deacetylase ChbG (UPF0249 family)
MDLTRRVIVTADDYGMCDSVNQAIEACLHAGTVRATCVMINMPVALSRPLRAPLSALSEVCSGYV